MKTKHVVKVLTGAQLELALDSHIKDGWELVHIMPSGGKFVVIFKRTLSS